MALTVVTNPFDFQLSKSPIIATLETDAYVQVAGDNAVILLNASSGSGAAAVGGTISFVWELGSVIFTIATTPDDSGYQVRPKGALSAADYAAQLVEDFAKNYVFSENYLFAVSGTSDIVIAARNSGPEYALYDNFSSINFGYVVNATHSDGTATEYAENYKMVVDIWMESAFGSGTYSKIGTQSLDPIDDTCIFDLQEEVNANLTFDFPSYGSTSKAICSNVIKRFYIRYHERYGNPVVPRQVNESRPGYALKAGVPVEEFNGIYPTAESLFAMPRKFLTHQPRTKKVRERAQEYLYFMVMDKISGHKLKTSVYIKGNPTPVVTLSASFGNASLQVWQIPVGFFALGLSGTHDWEDVQKYTVQVVNTADTTITTEVFTFLPDRDFYIDEHEVFFAQSCGGVDTVRLTGSKSSGFEVEKELVNKTVLYNTPIVDGEFAEVAHLKKTAITLSTGWLTKAQMDWLEALFLSEQKVIDYNGQYVPFVINNSTQQKHQSQSNIHSYELEITLGYNNITPATP